MTHKELLDYLKRRKKVIEKALPSYLPDPGDCPGQLREAMEYSIMAGGKRLRPILSMAAAEGCGGNHRMVLPAACAIEFIHTYSLIHDDLPAMDDDDFRRGRPTSHKVFGEAMAILAGDALLTAAFEILSRRGKMPDRVRIAVIRDLALASGAGGMIGGQVMDVASEGMKVDQETVIYIHRNKTAALITASLRAGAMIAGSSRTYLKKMTHYGEYAGQAFQIVDDLMDVEGEMSRMGKQPGSDEKRGKATFPSVAGMETSRSEAERLGMSARRAIAGLGAGAAVLDAMIDYILTRRS